jgi:hypothetical protein
MSNVTADAWTNLRCNAEVKIRLYGRGGGAAILSADVDYRRQTVIALSAYNVAEQLISAILSRRDLVPKGR